MSDIQAKVAARRAELVQEEKVRKAKQDALAREKSTHDHEALLNSAGEIDTDGLTPTEIEDELKKIAKRLWSTQENWLVFGLIGLGLLLMPVGGLGVVPIAIGLTIAKSLGKRYRKALIDRFPEKFGSVGSR
jgi:hypothetical protein